MGGKSYLLTPRFKKLLRRHLARFKQNPQKTTRIYNYFVDVAVAPKRALRRLRKHGLKGFLLEPNPERYPTTEVSLENQYAERDREAAERAAMVGLEAVITKLKQSGAILHSTPVRFSGSRGLDVTVEATISIQPGKVQEVTRHLNRSEVLMGPIRRPTVYPIQVAHRGKLPERQLQRMVTSIEGVQKIAAFPCKSERCAK